MQSCQLSQSVWRQERDTNAPPNHFLSPALWSNANCLSCFKGLQRYTLLPLSKSKEGKETNIGLALLAHCLVSHPAFLLLHPAVFLSELEGPSVSECSRKFEGYLTVPVVLVAEGNAAFGLQGL